MKTKFILLATITCMSIAGYSQTSIGLRAGVNFQNLNGKDEAGDKLNNKLKPGFNLGVIADIPVAPEYYFQTGALFSTKGAKINTVGDYKINLSYLEIPMTFLYKPVLGTGRLLMGVGPYIAFGVGGKVKTSGSDLDVKWKSDITPSEAADNVFYVKRFDAGGNLLFGYEFTNKLSAQLNAQLGLVDISPKVSGQSTKGTVKNTGFGISLGYRLK
jgi:hypothetical protein